MAALNPVNTSVIISTYRQPQNLCLTLQALSRQTIIPAEVMIADDGSSDETRHALDELAPELPFRLLHVWQPDKGFRAARSRNNAIHHARGEIIAFLDQDTLPHRLWLERMLYYLRPGHLCTGYLLNLPEHAAAQLDRKTIERGEFETCHSASEYKSLDMLQAKFTVYSLLRRAGIGIKGRPAFASGNAAAYRHNLLSVNGFDEEYVGWGQEDDDLGWRLYMSGIKPVPVVNRALVSHIAHPVRHDSTWKDGANIERYRRPRTTFKCGSGLDAHPHQDVRVTELDTSASGHR